MLHFNVEALGHDVQRVASFDLVLGLLLLGAGLGVGGNHGIDAPRAAFAGVLHDQDLAGLEVLAGQLVPALEILDVDVVGLGNGTQVVAALDPITAFGTGHCRAVRAIENRLARLLADQLFRTHGLQAGGQQLRLGRRHQQMLGTVDGGALLEGRVELEQLVFVDVGHRGDLGKVHALVDFDDLEVRFVGDRVEVHAVGFRRQHHLRQRQQLRHVGLGFRRQRQVPVVGGQAELFVTFDGAADRAFTGVVRRQGQQPIAVEHVVQAGQVIHRCRGRGGDVATAIVEARLTQIEITPGGRNELPQPDCIGPGIGHRVVGAFNHWQQGQFQRHVAFFEAFDDVVNIETAAFAGVLEERGIAGEPQALLLDARVDAETFLQLKALAHAFPDVLGNLWAGLFGQPDRLLLGSRSNVRRMGRFSLRSMAGTARQRGGHSHRDGLRQAGQCV
ncbi:hypothetical protein D3C87_1034270 [compost metagenome]